jgi:hypothetical protein
MRPDPAGFVALAALLVATPAHATNVPGGQITTDTTWSLAGSPYVIRGVVTIAGTDGPDGVTTVTIEPGVEVRILPGNNQLRVGGSIGSQAGALVADAAGGPPIVFRSDSLTPSPGDWERIFFWAGARPSTLLRHVVIEHGGRNGAGAIQLAHPAAVTITLDDVTIRHSASEGIQHDSGNLALSGCTIESTAGHSISFANAASIGGSISGCTLESFLFGGTVPHVDWSGNVFEGWGAMLSRIAPNEVGGLLADNEFHAVEGASLEVLAGTVIHDATWTTAAGALVALGSLNVRGTDGQDGVTTLAIGPGVTMRFLPTSNLVVGGASVLQPGALVADGDAGPVSAPIVFTSTEPAPAAGAWPCIRFWVGTQPGSLLRNAIVEYAGGGGVPAVELVQPPSVQVALEDVSIRHAGSVGILLAGAAALDGVDFEGTPIPVRASSGLAMTSTIRHSNLVGSELGVENLTPATACIDAAENWWGSPSGPSGVPPLAGCETDAPAGGGVSVTEGVIFDDWLAAPDAAAGACAGFEHALPVGWSMIGPALQGGLDAGAACASIASGSGDPAEIDRWYLGGWQGHPCGIPVNNFAIAAGAGYFVRKNVADSWCETGPAIPCPLAIDLDVSWNAVSLPRWAATRTAEEACAEVEQQGGAPVEIDRWHLGGWQGHPCGIPVNDFTLVPGEGYFVRVAAGSTWTIACP